MEDDITRAMQGDTNAFTSLIHCIQSDLVRIANARLDNPEDVNDAIQETMILAYQSIHKLKNPAYFKTWIIKILINECHKIYVKKKRKNNLFEKIIHFHNPSTEISQDIYRVEVKNEIQDLLGVLNYQEKICLILFYNNHYTVAEIASILNSSPNTIKSRITRAKQKLRKEKGCVIYEKHKVEGH